MSDVTYRNADGLSITLTSDQVRALRMIRENTHGDWFDVWDLMGDRRAQLRASIMSLLEGKPVPRGKAGVTAIRAKLWDLLQIDEGSLADMESRLRHRAFKILEAAK